MGLDATVYCDCFEKGRLRSAPLAEWHAYIDDYGGRSARTGALEKDLLFDQWNLTACQHESGVLVNYYIGNTAMVGFLRQSLSRRSELFPLILSKIIYNGIHAGDFIAAADVCLFEPELRGLSDFHCDDPSDDERIRHFQKQLRELVQAAMALHKPISF